MERTPRSCLERAHGGLGIGSASCTPPLGESVLHVWILDLALDRESLCICEGLLAPEEWRKVRRYYSRQLARRFIVRRGLLRSILGNYLDYPPKEVMFVFSAQGKPSLAPELSSDLQFSVSDSSEKAAIAVGLGEPIGIDIERLRPVQLDGGLDSCLAVQGKRPPAASPAAEDMVFDFFQAWTRHEALAKAEGVGLQMLPDLPSRKGLKDDAPSLPDVDGSLPGRGFHIHSLTLPYGFVGALAARLKTPEVVYFST